MHTEKIEFRQVRDFGEVINATFLFLRQNFKKLFACLLYVGGPFALLTGISITLFRPLSLEFNEGPFGNSFFSSIGVYMFFMALASAVIMAVVYHAAMIYQERGEFEVSEVWPRVVRSIPMMLLTYIGYGVMVFMATIFFLIPGLYTAIALSIIFVVRLTEGAGFFQALDRCFKLVANRWWRTFGLVFILAFVQYVLSQLIVIPLQLVGFATNWLSPSGNLELGSSTTFFTIVAAIQSMLSLLFSALLSLGLIFHYYSLVEEKESPGLMDKIRAMGTQAASLRDEEEEY